MKKSRRTDDFLFGVLDSKWKAVFQPETYQASRGVIKGCYTSPEFDHIMTIYPRMKAGLEICCDDGRRIRGGRAVNQNIFGINNESMEETWKIFRVDDFCQVGTVYDIPYEDNTFDFICYPLVLKYDRKPLREIKRVCNGNFYLQADSSVGTEKWMDTLMEEGFQPEVFNTTDNGNFVVEGSFLIGGQK